MRLGTNRQGKEGIYLNENIKSKLNIEKCNCKLKGYAIMENVKDE